MILITCTMARKAKITTVFLGLDGVVVDTESYYKRFWDEISGQHGLKIDNFSEVVEGMTLDSVIELYFPVSTMEERQEIRKVRTQMEQSINYKEIVVPGVLYFIKYLKDSDYKVGLVTSSTSLKVRKVLEQLDLKETFDTVITSDSIKKGKPDPMGYVLAKNNLGVNSIECAVFEDSFAGIKAATYAFMRVIGVNSSLSSDYLKDFTYGVISDFSDLDAVKKLLD